MNKVTRVFFDSFFKYSQFKRTIDDLNKQAVLFDNEKGELLDETEYVKGMRRTVQRL